MSKDEQIALIAAAAFAVFVSCLYSIRKRKGKLWGNISRRNAPMVNWMFLPGFLLLSLIVPILWLPGMKVPDYSRYTSQKVEMLLSLLILLSIYYAMLLLLLPLIRRRFRASTSAILWLLPTYLYLFTTNSNGNVFLPKSARLFIPSHTAKLLFLIWTVVATVILCWKILEHCLFRRRLLDASHQPDEEVLEVWNQVYIELGETGAIRVVVSSETAAPLSIGVWRSSSVVVLPEKEYSPQELKLILRHELIHIQHEDAGLKVFMIVCTAIAWFNPLMWVAVRKAAEDIELNCDETVLLDEPLESRREYAELILQTAADQRGFTTCLSASAKGLRYRLKSVMESRKKATGAFLLAICVFGLVLGYGWPGISVAEGTIGTRVFKNSIGEGIPFMAQHLNLYTTKLDGRPATCVDPDQLLKILEDYELYPTKTLIDDEDTDSEHELKMHFAFPYRERDDYYLDLILTDQGATIRSKLPEGFTYRYYLIQQPVDWESVSAYLKSA